MMLATVSTATPAPSVFNALALMWCTFMTTNCRCITHVTTAAYTDIMSRIVTYCCKVLP